MFNRYKYNFWKPASARAVLAVGMALAVNMFGTLPAWADTWYVAPDGPGQGVAGWGDATNNLPGAITAALNANAEVVLVSNGVYNISARITINKSLHVLGFDSNGLAGNGNPADVIVKGTNTMTVGCFYLNHADALLAGIMVTNGWSSQAGSPGGVHIGNGVMSNCIVTGCTALRGGGVRMDGGIIVTSLISGNIASSTTAGYGGGVLFGANAGQLLDSRISGNRAYTGGGVRIAGNNTVLENCTIAGNQSMLSRGGGVYVTAVTATLRNSIIYDNRHYSSLTGYTNWLHHASADVQYIHSCTVPTNDLPGIANMESDPLFAGSDNYRLKANSPCINAGLNRDWMKDAVDLDGYPRLDRFSRKVDIGCYEHIPRGTMFNFR